MIAIPKREISRSLVLCEFARAGIPVSTTQKFLAWHSENVWLWREFEKRALAKIEAGIEHFGAKAIIESIRFDVAQLGKSAEWQINNNYTAYYARFFALLHPEHKDFFETREVKGLRRAA